VKCGIDSLDLNIQQLEVDLYSFVVKMKNKVRQSFVSTKERQNHEGNEVNLDLPLYEQD